MGLRADTREELRKERTVTKDQGQPMDHDIMLLEKEVIAIAANIPTTFGGGDHGHARLIVEKRGPLEKTLPRKIIAGNYNFFVQPSLPKILSMLAQALLWMFFAIFLFVLILTTRPCCQ
jgi:hypothetical protein